MITQRIDELTYAAIEDLVQRQVPEGRVLDYKRDLPDRTGDKIKEFLADVASFANAGGGHLVFGVAGRQEAGKNTNLPDTICGVGDINVEQEILRLENVIRDGIQPRIVGLRVKALVEPDKPTVVVIHIPRSWNAPHMVAKGSSKFYSRTSAGKQPLDVTEIRHAFALSESVGERIKAFRDERIGRILAGETPVPIQNGATVVLHMMSVRAFSEHLSLNIKELLTVAKKLQPIFGATGWSHQTNFDGIVIEAYRREVSVGYVLLFRNGVIEAVDTSMLGANEALGYGKAMPAQTVEQKIIVAANNIYGVMKDLEIAPPLVSFMSLLNVRNYFYEVGFGGDSRPIDRDHLLMPDNLIMEPEETADVFLRSAFDMVWQACGSEGSPYYNAFGRWVAKQ